MHSRMQSERVSSQSLLQTNCEHSQQVRKTIKVYSLANIVSMLSSRHEFRLALGAIDAVLVCC